MATHMNKRPSLILACFFCSICAFAQRENSLESLKQSILDTLHSQKGDFAVAFKDLQTGKTLFINEHALYHAASTMKTPVLIEVYRQASRGKFSLSDSIELKNEFRSIVDSTPYALKPSDDSELELYKHIGEKRTIDSLVYLMITVSSNFATNLLVQKVGAQNVTKTIRKMGAKDLVVLRGVEDQKAYEKGMNNMVTAYDLMVLFEKIARGKAVSRKASDAMISVLMDQHFREIIPARLPPGVKVAHKTGFFTGVHHDSGIVFLPDGRKYILVILSKNLKNDEAATSAMASVSGSIYHYLNP
jgi:beta-lactamase class A